MTNGVSSLDSVTYSSSSSSSRANSTNNTQIYNTAYISGLEAEYENLETAYEKLEAEYDEYIKNYEEKLLEYQKAIEEAENEIISSAEAEYNPEDDGSWENFLNSRLENVYTDYSIDNLQSSYTSKKASYENQLDNIEDQMSDKMEQINYAKSYMSVSNVDNTALSSSSEATATGKGNNLSVDTTSGATVTAKTKEDLISLVSEEEYAYVDKYNIDLTEKMSDGSARYLFVKGHRDGKYHIFDMANSLTGKKSDGKTLPRLYGSYGQGKKVIDYGDGMLRLGDFNVKTGQSDGHGSWSSGQAEEIFWLESDGTVKSDEIRYKTYSPLSFDLNGDGVQTSDKKTVFDIDGDGVEDLIYDSADAVLVFDADGDGVSGEDGSECFGNNTDLDGDGINDGYKDGFEALKALASREGLIGENDEKLSGDDLKLLEEKYGLKIKMQGYNSQAVSLSEAGITEINLSKSNETSVENNFDGLGNQLMKQEGATFVVNGVEREYADIWHKKLN